MNPHPALADRRIITLGTLALAVAGLLAFGADKPAIPVLTSRPQNLSKMPKSELHQQLTPLQYHVACESGTEPPFRNEYFDHHAAGIYVDVISGEPLFASIHKFDSGTGWPSFWQALKKDAIAEKPDGDRTEVRGAKADSHLGHVFDDGPQPTGLRYCINSASLRFVPQEKLQELGYGEFLALFDKAGSADAPKK